MVTLQRPHTTVVLAMSADGKIADRQRSSPQFGSAQDKAHLEARVAEADAVLFGATTLKSGGTAMRVINPALIQHRQQEGKPAQPIQIVCTRTADLNPQLPFFRQPIPRWLLTTHWGATAWQTQPGFEQVLTFESASGEIDWPAALAHFRQVGIDELVVLGGGELVASLLALDLLDDFWLTVCPLLLGGSDAPTPVAGQGFLQAEAPHLELISAEPVGGEVYLHYRRQR